MRVSLLSATKKDVSIEEDSLEAIAKALSDRFGYRVAYETNMIHDPRQRKAHWPPYNGPFGSPRVCEPGTRRYPRRLLNLTSSSRNHLDWAFFHRYGEVPYSEGLPRKKSVSIFCRNAADGCIPCTFHCPGCETGGIRMTASGLSPYGIDSEVLGEAAIECIGSLFSGKVDIEYEKKGLLWYGYLPAAIRHFSGSWLNLALLDYLHRYSGVLADFEYPVV